MIAYDLAALAKLKKPVFLPTIDARMATYYAYLRILREMLNLLMRASIAEMTSYLAREQRELAVPDALPGRQIRDIDFTSLGNLSRMLARRAAAMVRRILDLEAKRHTDTFMETAKKTLGIDLAAVVREEDLAAYLDAASARNAGLITSLGDDAVGRVQRIVTDAIIRGTPVKDTRKAIAETFGVSDSRAQLIARDQTAKLNSDLNRIRHQQAGIEQYRWVTSHDERVRPRHRGLDGKIYGYDEPTGAEQGLPPGQPIQCRCIAQAIVEP